MSIEIGTKVYAINSLRHKKKKQELYEKNIVKRYIKKICVNNNNQRNKR